MKYLTALVILLAIVSCKKEFASPEIQKAYESVMLVHDEVMPEITTIQKLKRKIKKLDVKDGAAMNLITQLEKADDGMMDWMAGFKLNSKGSKTEQLKYLSAEQTKIDKVSLDMKKSIQSAQTYLKSKND